MVTHDPASANDEGNGFDFAPPPPPGGVAQAPNHGSTQAADASAAVTRRPGKRRTSRKQGRSRTNGRWVFVTMVAAIALILVGIGWAIVLGYRSSGVTPADSGATGTLHTGQVVAGMCIKEAPDLDKRSAPVVVVSCAAPHHAEAFIAYTFTSNAWPGTEQALNDVLTFCAAQLDPDKAYFPQTPEAPEFTWFAWVPTAETWRLGDRAGVCVVTTERPVAGSYGAGTAHDATTDAVIG